jgi:uncharacterized protein YukE
MAPPLLYRFDEIFRIISKIDTVQENMNQTVARMKGNADEALKSFTGRARQQYDNFIKAFDAEKAHLFKMLDDTQEASRLHVEKVRADDVTMGEAFGRTTSEI